MLNFGGSRVEILTSRIARNGVDGMIVHREEDRGFAWGVRKQLFVRHLTRHAASLHANGVHFDLRNVYVSLPKDGLLRCKRPSFGGQKLIFCNPKDIPFACRDAACRVKQ